MPSLRFQTLGLIFAVLVGLPPAAADENQSAPQAQLRAVTAAAVSAESERLLHQAFDHAYNLEFKPALKLFEQVAEAEPDSATVRAFWASALLYEILAQQGSLQTQLFVTSNEFLKHQRVPPDPELDRTFQEVSEEAKRIAHRRLEANPKDVDGLFALGLVYGIEANYLAGVHSDYLKGLRVGEKAFDLHKKLQELRPEIQDTHVVMGVHDYIIGNLSRFQRFLLFFTGTRGDRERGLEHLREAAKRGEFLRTYGKVLLGVAFIREGRLEEALRNAQELRAQYPRSPLLTLEQAKLHRQLKQYEEGIHLCQHLLADLIAHPHNPNIVGPEDALLELGKIEKAQGRMERALETLGRVSILPNANKHIWAQALLERGKIYDHLGEREKALAEYEKVIRLAAYPEVTRLALAYKDQPYQPESEN